MEFDYSNIEIINKPQEDQFKFLMVYLEVYNTHRVTNNSKIIIIFITLSPTKV